MNRDQITACIFAQEGGIAMLWDDDYRARITTFRASEQIRGVYERLRRSDTNDVLEADLISETDLDGTQRLMIMLIKKPDKQPAT